MITNKANRGAKSGPISNRRRITRRTHSQFGCGIAYELQPRSVGNHVFLRTH